MTKAQPTMTKALAMKKMPPNVHSLTDQDHLPSVRRLRVQVMTNSKGYMELNLNHRGLRMVPAETFQLSTTQVLRLDHNYIDFLPMMIAYLRGLRVLDLQHNVLVHLPETLVNCKHLAELRLTGNRLASLPRSFGGLRNLRILELGENQLEQLPQEIGQLSSLRVLDLHSNRLWHVPFSLQELRHLTQLNLSDNMFDHVPLVVTKVTSLKALNLSRNRLGSLPLDFDSLRGLRELNLSHNKLVTVSSLLVTLKNLKYLSLASNSLKFLPPQMSQLQNLHVLHLQDNQLRHVPSCLRRLRYYNISTNQITSFSVEGMRNLFSLTASSNRMEAIPRGLYKLKQLKFLYLDNNCLVELDEDTRFLKELRVLDLSHNNLVSLPKAVHRLPLLHSFNIKGNYKLTQGVKGSKQRHSSTYHDNEDERTEKAQKLQQFEVAKGSRGEAGRGIKVMSGEVLFSNDAASEGTLKWRESQTAAPFGRHNRWDLDRSRSMSDLRKRVKPPTLYGSGRRSQRDAKPHRSLGTASKSVNSDTHHSLRHGHESQRNEGSNLFKIFAGRGGEHPSIKKKSLRDNAYFTERRSEKTSESGSDKKSKFYSVKSFKDLFRRSKKSSSSQSSFDVSKTAMKSSKSLTFPMSYSLDEVDHGVNRSFKSSPRDPVEGYSRTATPANEMGGDFDRRSKSTKSKNKSNDSDSQHDKGYSDDEVIGDRQIGYMQREDERDWRSLSHGYGSWRSKNQGPRKDLDVWSADSKAKKYLIHEDNSSDSVTSDFSYHEYRLGVDNHHFRDGHLHGNDRYSVNGEVGAPLPRPSSRSRWVGQWYGPDYESTMTKSELDNQSYDYSIREANASFATETTATRRPDMESIRPDVTNKNNIADLSFQMTAPLRHRGGQNSSRNDRMSYRNHHKENTHLHGMVPLNTFTDDSPSRYSMRSWKSDSMLNQELHSHHISRKSRWQAQKSARNTLHNKYASKERLLEDSKNYDDYIEDVVDSDDEMGWIHDQMVSEDNISEFESRGRGPKFLSAPTSSRVSHITDYVDAGLDPVSLEADRAGYYTDFIPRSKSMSEFDNIMTTNQRSVSNRQDKNSQNQKIKQKDRSKPKKTRQLDDNFTVKERTLTRRRSMDSLLDYGMPESKSLGSGNNGHIYTKRKRLKAATNEGKDLLGRTDYTLLGVCNQIETLINKNLLQPVIGWRGSHKFSDKIIHKTTNGLWRLGEDGEQDDDDRGGTGNAKHQDIGHEDDSRLPGLKLNYLQPQAFNVTSSGGQFVTSESPEVKVTVPAHAIAGKLQVTIQVLKISSDLLMKAKRLNHFIDNIIFIGPIVYLYTCQEHSFNSPVSLSLPAPRAVKGGHLLVLTIKRDNSCVPCNSGYRSGVMEATVSAWQLTAKVAVIAKARCKYKACKSVEHLLDCVGATQV